MDGGAIRSYSPPIIRTRAPSQAGRPSKGEVRCACLLDAPRSIPAASKALLIVNEAGLSQIACSTSAIGCKSVTNRKSLSKKLDAQRAHPSAVTGSYDSEILTTIQTEKIHQLAYFYDRLP